MYRPSQMFFKTGTQDLVKKEDGGADLPKHKQKGTPTNFNNLQNPNFGGWEGQYIYIIYHDLVDL